MVIALSGKCCSGKNYISDKFKSDGFTIIDVDIVSRDVFNSNQEQIIQLFGESVVVDGILSRKAVGEIVFSDKQKRLELEELIHPKVYQFIINQIKANSSTDYIINIPLLKKSELIEHLNGIVWIRSPLLLRIIRALKRDSYSLLVILKRIWSQKKLSVKYFKSSVDIYYIDNSWFSKQMEGSYNLTLNRLRKG